MALRVFGLTGGIGSGKSAVAQRFRARGLPVVDADALARLAVAPGSLGLSQIVERFGRAMLTASGELDRPRLAELVFSSPEARRDLDSLVHPAVHRLSVERFQELGAQGEPLACYEVPLLYEVGLERSLSPVVVVSAPEALRRARLTARDGLSETQVDARIAAQMPLAEKVSRADYVIGNEASLRELAERGDAVLDAVCRALNVDPSRYPAAPLS